MKAGARIVVGLALLAGPWGGHAVPDEPDRPPAPERPTRLPLGLELHRPNYVLPLTWTDFAENEADAEFKFQISLKYQVAGTPFHLGYTQVAYWRWLDEQNSSPFREINFNPEAWYRFRPGRLSPDWLGVDIGFEHESNGEEVPESRGWNRVYVRPYFQEGGWQGSLKLWERIPESGRATVDDPDGDDNPRILDFYGHHELRLSYTFGSGQRLSARTRYAFSEDRGALRLEYMLPTGAGDSYYFVQLFSGYGESLETFKDKRTRIGVGFAAVF